MKGSHDNLFVFFMRLLAMFIFKNWDYTIMKNEIPASDSDAMMCRKKKSEGLTQNCLVLCNAIECFQIISTKDKRFIMAFKIVKH